MAASCFSMATTHKLPLSLELSSLAGGGGVSATLRVQVPLSLRLAMPVKCRAAVADAYSLQLPYAHYGFSCFNNVMGSRSRGLLTAATAWSEGPLSVGVKNEEEIPLNKEEDKGFESEDFSEGEVLESEEFAQGEISESDEQIGGDVEAVAEGQPEQSSEGEGSYDQNYPPIPEGTKLYVGNLPFDIDSEELARIFEESGVVEMVEVIYDKATERSRGFAFVTMSTVEEAEAAIQRFRGSEVGGRPLRVNFPEVPRGGARSIQPRSYTNNYVDSPHKVYVGNLPFSTTSDALRSAFDKIGNVLGARVVFDRETGRSRGFGFVTFSSEADVDAAISSMNGE
ncbi:hypothetical protein KI387_006167, partial [Taxus chinensis]